MLKYQNKELYIQKIPASKISSEFGTPCFVYSEQEINKNIRNFFDSFAKSNKPARIFYAVKANSNISILKLLVESGAGFDCVSLGEIERVLIAGGEPQDIVFSGVGKTKQEIERSVELGIHSINVESPSELTRVQQIASDRDVTAQIAIRVNPDVAADTHAYVTTGKKQDKFGVAIDIAHEIVAEAIKMPNIHLAGISCHIGSQITSVEPFAKALKKILAFMDSTNHPFEFVNIGGGLGVVYKDEHPPSIQEYAKIILDIMGDRNMSIHLEPGRAIIANAGVLLTKVEYVKDNFAIVDAGMNDLIRPALYQSYHEIIPVTLREENIKKYNVVGPVCETGDSFGKDRELAIQQDDILAIKSCGAYCFSASSNYNTRPRPAEVLVTDNRTKLIRKRESLTELWQNELI